MNPKKRSNAWGKDGHWMLIALLTNVAFSVALLQMQMVSDTESADIICSALGTKRNGLFQKLTREGSSCCILISQFWEKYVQLYTYQDLDPCCQVVNPKVPKSVYIQQTFEGQKAAISSTSQRGGEFVKLCFTWYKTRLPWKLNWIESRTGASSTAEVGHCNRVLSISASSCKVIKRQVKSKKMQIFQS